MTEVVFRMVRASTTYEACQELFTRYPQAVTTVSRRRMVRSMVVMLEEGDHAGFFVLLHKADDGNSSYSVWSWPACHVIDIPTDNDTAVPDIAVDAVTHGVPIPRDGSLFGWTFGDVVTALIVIYAQDTPDTPEPGWSVMPLVGVPEAQWPPFAGKPLFRHWSWESYRSGIVIGLDNLIAITSDTVFWVDTKASLGSSCCAVAHDIKTSEGHTLRCGRYVYYEVLRAGKDIPVLRELLADPGRIDLAPRLQDTGGCGN